MKGRALFARFTVGLLAVLGLFASSAEASVSASLDVSSIKGDPFAALPQLTSRPIAERLAAVEQNAVACAALCELAASIDSDPLGYGTQPRPFGGLATPFGRQYFYAHANPTSYWDPFGYEILPASCYTGGNCDARKSSGPLPEERALFNFAKTTVEGTAALVGTTAVAIDPITAIRNPGAGQFARQQLSQIPGQIHQGISDWGRDVGTISANPSVIVDAIEELGEDRAREAYFGGVLMSATVVQGGSQLVRSGGSLGATAVSEARTAIPALRQSIREFSDRLYWKPMPPDLLRGTTMGMNGVDLYRGTLGRIGLKAPHASGGSHLLDFEGTHVAVDAYLSGGGKGHLGRLAAAGRINAADALRIRSTALLQRLASRQSARLSTPGALEAALSVGQRAALKRLPFLRHRYYGSVLESAVADRIARSASLSDLFEHVGSRAGSWSEVSDFAGRGIFRGLEYDITTPGQLWKKHWKYGEDVLVPRYVR